MSTKWFRSWVDKDGIRHLTVNGKPLPIGTELNEELYNVSLAVLESYFEKSGPLLFAWQYYLDLTKLLLRQRERWTLTSGDIERHLGFPPKSILSILSRRDDDRSFLS